MAALPGIGLIRKFFGSTISQGGAYAMGAATADTLRPVLQSLTNETWSLHAVKPPDAGTLAAGVAQGQVDPGDAADWAAQQGIGPAAFAALRAIADTGPAFGQALDMYRRDYIDDNGFKRALNRMAIEPEWRNNLAKLRLDQLDPGQLAAAIHRGLLDDQGLLVGSARPGPGNVPAYPVYPINAITEAAWSGFDRDRLGVLVGLQGQPMGAHEAAQATFRGVVQHSDFLRAVAESNVRNEWADAIFEQSRQIPSVTNYVEAHVRGWIDEQGMLNGAGRHGMSPEDAQLEFLIHGRPLSWHQVWIGLKRGGRYDGPLTDEKEVFYKALRESSLRPEWYDLAWAQRYTLPATFALRTMAQSGDLTQPEVEEILKQEGWEPTLAAKVSAKWAAPATAKADPWVGKAETKLWTDTLKAYLGGALTHAQAGVVFDALQIAPASQTRILELLDLDRRVEATAANVPAPAPL